jgi:ABC-type antimicrobial peptide transport system ATPase subunit
MRKALKLAVTGNIGSGKSVVSRMLSIMGVPVYDCDSRAKALMNSALVLLVYKPTSKLIRRIGLAKPSTAKGSQSHRDTIIVVSVAAVVLVAAIVIFAILRK